MCSNFAGIVVNTIEATADTRRKKKHIIDSRKEKLNWGSSPTDNNNDSIKATKSSKRKGRTKGKARKHIDDADER